MPLLFCGSCPSRTHMPLPVISPLGSCATTHARPHISWPRCLQSTTPSECDCHIEEHLTNCLAAVQCMKMCIMPPCKRPLPSRFLTPLSAQLGACGLPRYSPPAPSVAPPCSPPMPCMFFAKTIQRTTVSCRCSHECQASSLHGLLSSTCPDGLKQQVETRRKSLACWAMVRRWGMHKLRAATVSTAAAAA